MKTVFVCAWEYASGGGFDWYHTAEARDKAFEKEKENCNDPLLKKDNWTAFSFDVEIPEGMPDEDTASYIDFSLDDFCLSAGIKFPSWDLVVEAK